MEGWRGGMETSNRYEQAMNEREPSSSKCVHKAIIFLLPRCPFVCLIWKIRIERSIKLPISFVFIFSRDSLAICFDFFRVRTNRCIGTAHRSLCLSCSNFFSCANFQQKLFCSLYVCYSLIHYIPIGGGFPLLSCPKTLLPFICFYANGYVTKKKLTKFFWKKNRLKKIRI